MVPEYCEGLLQGRRKFLSQLSLAAAASGLAMEKTSRAGESKPAAPLLPLEGGGSRSWHDR